MQKYNCIIVEDEPIAAEVLEDYIRQVPFLELKAAERNDRGCFSRYPFA
jgi:response regulator of citrate/malate metabolism